MSKIVRTIKDVALYLVIFFMIQYLVTIGIHTIFSRVNDVPWNVISQQLIHGQFSMSGKLLIAVSVLSSVLTISVFICAKWAYLSRAWLSTRPWGALLWVVFLALGAILPSQWLQEQLDLGLPETTEHIYESIMAEPLGYLTIGVLVPIAEELVFRGAILRSLLTLFGTRWHWVAIFISAILFGVVHGNPAQFIHAGLMGMLIGWMYYRTGSIFPGVVFHWINNTVAYLLYSIMPQSGDGKLIDLFHGDSHTMWLGLAFSMCVLLPSLYQLCLWLKHN